MYYIYVEALDSKFCNSGGRWYLWRDMSKIEWDDDLEEELAQIASGMDVWGRGSNSNK